MAVNFRWELRAMYKILIVDDEKIERNGIRMLLNSLGYSFEIAEASNGQAAYDLMSGNEFEKKKVTGVICLIFCADTV